MISFSKRIHPHHEQPNEVLYRKTRIAAKKLRSSINKQIIVITQLIVTPLFIHRRQSELIVGSVIRFFSFTFKLITIGGSRMVEIPPGLKFDV